MAKIALVTDLHFGCRNDNQKVADFQERFFKEVFFPYIDENSIDTVVDLGDTFDRRKFINFYSLDRAKKMFFTPLAERKITVHMLVGNHDSFYKNTLEINSVKLLAEAYPNIVTYEEPTEWNGIVMLPWICDDNRQQTDDLIAKTKCQVLFGHLELSGYQMYRGQVIPGIGMKDDFLSKFDLVCSGHFHTKSQRGNINYLGTPYEMTWSDADDQKGFHIYDTDDRSIEFIKNPNTMFKKIWYSDEDAVITDIIEQDFSQYRNCFVKLIVKNKTNPYWFDMFIERLEKQEPIHLQVVEDHLNLDLEDEDELIQEAEDTLTILHNYVNSLDTVVNKEDVSSVIGDLYSEALTIN
jgi:DNA repair exonuclease SbcCD nuclease subunit